MDKKKTAEQKHTITELSSQAQDLMTEAQKERGRYYLDKYIARKAEFDEYRAEFESIQNMLACERTPDALDPHYPNNFIPLMTPAIEGQTAAMLESDIEFNYISNNPLHKTFLPQIEACGAYCRDMNKAFLKYKDYTRNYLALGNSWITVMYEKTFSHAENRPKGFPKVIVPDIDTVFADGKIKDYKDLQYSEYIIHELGYQDIAWARKEYGDDKAEALRQGAPVPSKGEVLHDDHCTFTLLHVWTRNNDQENLQLIEMDTNGFILRESDPSKPYYAMVGNEYPFWFGRMIPRPNSFYGHGDGKLIKYMQTYINRIADEIEVALRHNAQPKTYIAPEAKVDPAAYTSDPSKFILAKNPKENIMVVQGQGINPIAFEMFKTLLDQAQRAPRFSDIMIGNQQGVSATATQISGQMAQGQVGIKDKASDIQQAMAWCDRYCLQICLEKWDIPFWATKFRTVNGSPEETSEFVDLRDIARVPAVVPTTGKSALSRMFKRKKEKNMDIVDYDVVMDKKKATLIDLDFDVRVKLAAGFPKDAVSRFNQIIALMQMQVMNAEGQPEPFMPVDVAKREVEQIVGFKFSASDADMGKSKSQLLNAGAINPIGNSGEVNQPQGSRVRTQPSNLANTVPLAGDNRGMQL